METGTIFGIVIAVVIIAVILQYAYSGLTECNKLKPVWATNSTFNGISKSCIFWAGTFHDVNYVQREYYLINLNHLGQQK